MKVSRVRCRLGAMFLSLFGSLLLLSPGSGAVVINEIHYNPADGAALEFVELHNTEAQAVAVGGWSFTQGIRFVFPANTTIEPNGFLVLCQNRSELAARFGIAVDMLQGDFSGSLDNGGESLALVDDAGVLVEELRYDDTAPWDTDADGAGASLERICPTFDASHPGNWAADSSKAPTPLAPSHLVVCPPPDIPPPAIAITEIGYHPLGDKDDKEEFVELRNNTASAINLKGYAFTSGIDYIFAEDRSLAPGGFLVLCRNVDAFKAVYDVPAAIGNFTGQLSNEGERLTLVDPQGNLVDSVRYADSGDWPVAADGLSHSLEKILPEALSDDPASWREAGIGDLSVWRHVELTGTATSSKILVFIDAPGEFIIDNLRLSEVANPDVNLLANGGFDAGLEPWLIRGNHADSQWDASGGPDGSGALRIISSGRGTGAPNGISLDVLPELARNGPLFKLSFDYKYVTGSQGLDVRISGSSLTRGIQWKLGAGSIQSPGEENKGRASHLPPFVSGLGRFPREPGASDPVWIIARARAVAGLESLTLTYQVNAVGDFHAVQMLDDGKNQDGASGDGIYGGQIPPQPHNTIVTFTLLATDAKSSSRSFPAPKDPTGAHGYYVNDLKPQSHLPTYTLLVRHTTTGTPRTIMASLNCQTWLASSLAYGGDLYYNVGIRQRGQSVCGSSKPYLKIRFQRGRDFVSPVGTKVHKMNLQSLWTDKSLVREGMSWEVFDELGMPACFEEFARIHVNGKYYGLYGALEHPDSRFLERNRLNPDGNLYKATASTEEVAGVYEKKTNEHILDTSDLRTFLQTMHATARPQLRTFFEENVDGDRLIDYQLAQTLTNNSDYPHKNHYLYHDTARGKWMPLAWDMDLTFGKIWDGNNGGVLHDKMHTPGNNPWYTTSVDGGLGNHLLDKFFSQAGDHFRRAYVVRLFDALEEKYTEEFFVEKMAFLRDFLMDEQAEDIAAWGRSPATADDRTAPKDFLPNLERVRQHVKARRAYLMNYVRTRSRLTGHDRLKITEVMYNPPGAGEDLEFLELWNPGSTEIDVAGWSIEGLGYQFPAGTRVAAGEVFVLAKNPGEFSSKYGDRIRVLGPFEGGLDNSGETLRLKDAGPGYPATVDFLRYDSQHPWPREGDGIGYSIELSRVTSSRDNDLGIYWRRSRSLGGSPGKVEGVSPELPLYARGDVNADGLFNLTDAIAILRYLYQGAGEPACLAAADLTTDKAVKLDDAIFVLQYLFQDTGVALASPVQGECGVTDATQCQQSNCKY